MANPLPIVFVDNCYGTIASGISASATSIALTTGHGVRFPAIASGQVLYATLLNSSNVLEQIHITAHTASSDTLTVVRGVNGTTAKAWSAGDRIECRLTSEHMTTVSISDLRWFGVTMNTSDNATQTANTTAINVALTTTGRLIRIPTGTVYYNGNLGGVSNIPTCSGLVGEGELVSILQPSTAVTRALDFYNGTFSLRDFKIQGNGTTTEGLYLGSAVGSPFTTVDMSCVQISDFTLNTTPGTTGIGLRIDQVLKSTFRKLTVNDCGTCLKIDHRSDGTNFPTTCVFIGGSFINALYINALIKSGYGVQFYGTVFESAKSEGVAMVPDSAGTGTPAAAGDQECLNYTFYRCDFEDNYTPGNASNFQFVANGGASTALIRDVVLDACIFNPNNSSGIITKAIEFTGTGGTNCDSWLVNNPYVNNVANIIAVTAGTGKGSITNLYPTYLTGGVPTELVQNLSSFLITGYDDRWRSYAVTADPNGIVDDTHNQAATFAVGPTVSVYRYQINGKRVVVELQWSGTLQAITPPYIKVRLPNLVTQGNLAYTPALVTDNNVLGAGMAYGDGVAGASYIVFKKVPNANFTSGSVVGGAVTITLELA